MAAETFDNATTVEFEKHPNLGYLVYADFKHVGSVNKYGGRWLIRSLHSRPLGSYLTRHAAVQALIDQHRELG